MSRTREYKVLVSENFFQRDQTGISNIIEDEGFETRLNGIKTFKAKLIIELPSPRITISEDDVDKAFNSIRYLEVHENNLCPYTVRHLRMALFKDAE